MTRPPYTLRKVTEQGYVGGLATTGIRTSWEAVRPDGTRLTSGRTRAEADANARHVLEEAERLRS
jgi:hypothetical protein